MWSVYDLEDEVHVIPKDDLFDHTKDRTCPCKPRLDLKNRRPVVIHSSFDEREFKESNYTGPAQRPKIA